MFPSFTTLVPELKLSILLAPTFSDSKEAFGYLNAISSISREILPISDYVKVSFVNRSIINFNALPEINYNLEKMVVFNTRTNGKIKILDFSFYKNFNNSLLLNFLNLNHHLTSLNLCDYPSLSKQSIDQILKLTFLTTLRLTWSNDDVIKIAELSRLNFFEISTPEHFDESNFDKFSQLTNLHSLKLARSFQISSINPIQNLTQLTHLDLSHGKLIVNLTPLMKLHRLLSLNLAHCQFFSIEEFSKLPESLKTLNLSGRYLENMVLKIIPHCITSLSLDDCGGLTCENLKSLPLSLTSLSLVNTRIIDSSLREIANRTNLTYLNVCGCLEISKNGLKCFKKSPFTHSLHLEQNRFRYMKFSSDSSSD